MKIQPRQVDSFIKSPSPEFHAILLYGPDEGLVRERVTTLGKTVVKDLQDPFNVVELTPEIINDDPARLTDEANALSMMGGRRFIRIRGATDKLTRLLKGLVPQLTGPENLIVIEAGELGTRSSLRLFFEKEKNTAAIACYVEDERDLSRFITERLRSEQFSISRDALNLMASNLVGNRAITQNEIDKLILYMGTNKRQIEASDVLACIGNNASMSLGDIALLAASGETAPMDQKIQQMFHEGMTPIAILRATQNHFRRLHLVKSHIGQGQTTESAIKKLRPPLYFKQKSAFHAQLKTWSLAKLNLALEQLNSTEAECKKTGNPDKTLCSRVLFVISRMARHKR